VSNDAAPLQRPVPRSDPVAQGFWDAAAEGKLVIQRCAACRTLQHPPRPVCRACGGTDLAFEPVSGEARLTSWTVTHHNVLAGFARAIPYTVMVVELVEQAGLYLLSDLVGREGARSALRVGMPMQVEFNPAAGGPLLAQFSPLESAP
jgi:hypothetical protein